MGSLVEQELSDKQLLNFSICQQKLQKAKSKRRKRNKIFENKENIQELQDNYNKYNILTGNSWRRVKVTRTIFKVIMRENICKFISSTIFKIQKIKENKNILKEFKTETILQRWKYESFIWFLLKSYKRWYRVEENLYSW